MEIKQEKLENYVIGTKRKTPFNNNVNVTTTLLKKVKEEIIVPQNETEEIEMKTDIEIKATISRMNNNLKNFGFKLHDGGEKLKASLRKYEDELERRVKINPPPVLPVNIPVSAEVEPNCLLTSSPAPPPEPQQAPNTHSVDSVQHIISNGASNISSPNRGLEVNKPLSSSGSQHRVATCVSTADANIHDPWIEEMMQTILNEVVTESIGRKPSVSGNDECQPVTFLKGSSGVFGQQNQELHIELKTDSEIKEIIARLKRNLAACGHKLHDKGEKIKESILRYEHELQRRNKINPPPVLPVNIPVSAAEVEPKSLLLSSPAPPPEPQQSPNTHSIDSVQQMISNGVKKEGASNISFPNRGLAVNKPLSSSGSRHGVATCVPTADANIHDPWTDEMMQNILLNDVVTLATESTGRKPSPSGNDGRPPVTFLKGSSRVFVQQNQEQDIELKTDSEIKEIIARLKRNLASFGHKLHDKGEKIKESILRYEHELQRRNKIRPGVLPVNIPVSAQVNPTSQLLSPPPPQECPQSPVTHLVDSVKQMVSNDENKDGDSNLPSRDQVAGNKPSPFSGSQYGVAANGLTSNADKHDSLTDEKMLKIVHELVTVGIAHTEVGKAAEICYKDPVKAKVLFALPGHLRKSYVCGFLYPRK